MNRVIDKDKEFKNKIGELLKEYNKFLKYNETSRGIQLAIADIVRIFKLRKGDFNILDNNIVVNWKYLPDRSHMPGNLNTHTYIKYKWSDE